MTPPPMADIMEDVIIMPRRFTVREYYRMAEAGILGEDDRVELLDGQVVAMSPIGGTHALCLKCLNMILAPALAGRALVGIQAPVRLDDLNEPVPDVSVIDLALDRYGAGHAGPDEVYFLVEVCDTSIRFDRSVKLPLYARFGIRELWLVDLPEGRVEVYRTPKAGNYTSFLIYGPPAPLSPAAFPDVIVDLGSLLRKD